MPPYLGKAKQCSLHNVNCLWENSGKFNINKKSLLDWPIFLVDIFSSLQPPWDTQGFNETTVEGMECDCLPSCSDKVNKSFSGC